MDNSRIEYSEHFFKCSRCKTPYDWRKSTSMFLKMTYCGFLCEVSDLGFCIEELTGKRVKR